MTDIEVNDVNTFRGDSHILHDINMRVEDNENVAILGRNGVGKTILMRTILQIDKPRTGSVWVKGQDVTGLDTNEVAKLGVGWVPEDRRVFNQLTVEENLRISVKSGDIDEKVEEAFATFPLLTDVRGRRAIGLSGGEQQMLSVARAMIGGNDILMVDEPSEGLSPMLVNRITSALKEASEGMTLVVIEQNLGLALDLTDRFYILDNGQVVEEGDSDEVSEDDEKIMRYLSA